MQVSTNPVFLQPSSSTIPVLDPLPPCLCVTELITSGEIELLRTVRILLMPFYLHASTWSAVFLSLCTRPVPAQR